MGYLCFPTPSSVGVKEQAGGRLWSQERQELQGEERGTPIACSSAVPSPLARTARLCAHLGASARFCLAQAEAAGSWGAGVAFWEEEGPYSSS